MNLERIISNNVKTLRHLKGFSQKRLSELTGIDIRQLSKLENRPGPLTTTTIERLCIALEVSPTDLISGKIELPRPPKISKNKEKGIKEAISILKQHLNTIKK